MNNQGNNWNDNRSGGGFYPEQEIKRTYTPEEAGHERQRKPVSRFRHRRHRPPNPGVVLILLVFAVVFGVCIYMLASGRSRPVSEEDFLQSAVSTNDSEASPIGGNNREQTLTLTEDQVHTGDLILVNYAYPYTFPADEEA